MVRKITAMRSLSTSHRLQGFSLPEILRQWEGTCINLGAGVTVNGRKLKPGPMLNALVLAFIHDLSPEQQWDLARKGVERLEAMMANDEAAPGLPGAVNNLILDVKQVPDRSKAVRRKKRG